MPFVSIVIPVYNRAAFIGRAIDSCLTQDFGNFEIVVVDDGSSDESVAAVREYTDPRIRLILHHTNLGVSAARNTGAGAADGEWILCLDSDDELTAGALATIQQRASEVSEDIAGLRFMCLTDRGTVSPDPPLRREVWEYEDYLSWIGAIHDRPAESLVVVRRSTFNRVRYPGGLGNAELLYHLDFAQCFLTEQFPDIVRLYHQDAENQITRPDARRLLVEARGRAQNTEALLTRHGAALARLAPEAHLNQIFMLAFQHFLRGKRLLGLQTVCRCLLRTPFVLRTWGMVALGLIGPNPLAVVAAYRRRKRLM